MKKTTSGFTIVELIIVVVVIAVLAAISLIVFNGAQGRTRDARRLSDIENIIKALELYYNDNGSYPIASGTNASAGASWYSSDTTSWTNFGNIMPDLNPAPSDPRNVAGNVTSAATARNYAYFSGAHCGSSPG